MGTTISGDTGITFPDATTQSKAVSQSTPFAVTASATTGAQISLPEGTNNGAHFVALKAADTLAANTTFTLPAADGTNGQFLQTNGSGALAFASVAPGGTTGQVQYNNAGAFGGLSSGTSGQVLTSAGAGAAPTWSTVGGFSNLQVFTSSGTFTVPAGITKVKVTVVGGGGNGGNCNGCAVVQASGGGGGGGGSAVKVVSGLTPGGTVSVTVGTAAGTSSFGAFCSATGGSNGSYNGNGGAGGAGSSGDLNMAGGSGGNGGTGSVAATYGGTSIFGGAGGATTGSGKAGGAYGGGGSGAYTSSSATGGAGAAGVVIVEY